jgi:hypothetical protein
MSSIVEFLCQVAKDNLSSTTSPMEELAKQKNIHSENPISRTQARETPTPHNEGAPEKGEQKAS